jgi:hypothetical protein
MPLTPEQQAALTALFTGDDAPLRSASAEDIAAGIQSAHPSTYNLVINTGRAAAGGEESKDLKKLRRKLETAEAEVTTLRGQMSSGATPEVKKQLEDGAEEIRKLRGQVQTMEEQHERERQELAESEVLNKLGSLLEDPKLGQIRSPWAKVLKQDPDLRKRIEVKIEDGKRTVTVYQHGKKVPIAADDDTEEAMLKALAVEQRERLKKEEPEAIRAAVDNGGGVRDTTGGGEQGYDPAKEGREMAAKAKNQSEATKGLAFR